MRYIHCPSNPRIRCYENSERTCPLKMRKWMDTIERWALTGRTPRSLDTSAVLGPINIRGSEVSSVRSANVNQIFDNPEAVLGWIMYGERRQAPITKSICRDLKRGWRKWTEAKREERFSEDQRMLNELEEALKNTSSASK